MPFVVCLHSTFLVHTHAMIHLIGILFFAFLIILHLYSEEMQARGCEMGLSCKKTTEPHAPVNLCMCVSVQEACGKIISEQCTYRLPGIHYWPLVASQYNPDLL